MPTQPPRIPAWLRRRLDAIEPDALVDDLEEEFLEHVLPSRGKFRANLWFWKHVLLSAIIGSARAVPHRRPPDHGRARGSAEPLEVLQVIVYDLRHALRMLVKQPGLALMAIITIALGVGLTTHTFSMVYGSVRDLPYEGADRLMALMETRLADGSYTNGVPAHTFADWRTQQQWFADLGAFYQGNVNLADPGQPPERSVASFTSGSVFAQVGASPLMGRTFSANESSPHGPRTAVLGHELWRARYAADPDILGRIIAINGIAHTVIGVMPPRYAFPFNAQIWLPLGIDPASTPRGTGPWWLVVVGRLRPGVSIEDAEAGMAGIAEQLARTYPRSNEGLSVDVIPYVSYQMPPQITNILWLMFGAVVGVLLIACSNVTNLLLARAAARSKEIAVRAALGASRARVILQMMAESMVVALVGGAVGLVLAKLGIDVFNAVLQDIEKPYWIDISLSPPVLLFGIAATLVASVAAGTIPALKASGLNLNAILTDQSRGATGLRMSRISTALVVAEVAVSSALLVGAGFMVKSVIQVNEIDLGFVPTGVFTARLNLPEADYPDAASRIRFHDDLLQRLDALPGVQHASTGTALPATQAGLYRFGLESASYPTDQDYPAAHQYVVSPNYFATLGIPLLEGRVFTAQDRDHNIPVAIVNRSFVRRFSAAASPLGGRLRFGGSQSTGQWLTIVGVVGDVHVGGGPGGVGSDAQRRESIFMPLAQQPRSSASIVLATDGDPMVLTPDVRATVAAIDPNLPIYEIDSMEGVIDTNTWIFGLFGSMFGIFGMIALFMSAVGLYGVMAFSVNRRTQEMGIRMAMGASTFRIMRMVLRTGLSQIAIGMIVGLAVGALAARPLRYIMFDVETNDLSVYGSIVLTLVLTGLIACLAPARRATRVDLVTALRAE